MDNKFPRQKNILHLYTMVQAKQGKLKTIGVLLRRKYRLILLNDTSLDEKFSVRLSPLNTLIGILALTIIMTSLVISLIAFTGLREYIPGYGTTEERLQMLKLSYKADSLEKKVQARDAYLQGLLTVLTETGGEASKRPSRDSSGKYVKLNTEPSKADIAFRQEFELKKQDKPLAQTQTQNYNTQLQELLFFSPVKGIITRSFDPTYSHFGTDIATKEDELIKATLDGTIIYRGFTAEDGNIIQIQHSNNVVSLYKHCAMVLKSAGEKVKSGEAIAVVGNTGENSKGAHLHFELWFNGIAVNAQDFVTF
jgi:murein DD-endopeptidase MepM/ murein hydrolase activator NlpD